MSDLYSGLHIITMDKATALKALSLDDDASAEAIELAYQNKIVLIEQRIEQAANETLRSTFSQLKERLAQARDALLHHHGSAAPTPIDGMDIGVDDTPSDIQQFLAAQEKSARNKRIGLLLTLLLLLGIGAGWYTGLWQSLWERYRPLTAEEQAAMDESIQLQQDIVQYEEALMATREQLKIQVQQAQLALAPEQAVLEETLALADKSVFMTEKRKTIPTQLEEAQQLFEQRKHLVARDLFLAIATAYQELQQTYTEVEQVPPSKAAAQAEQAKWQELQETYELTAPAEAEKAAELWQSAETRKDEEAYVDARIDYDEARGSYLAAQEAVADEVAAIRARIEARRLADAKRRAKRLAWLKSVTPKMVDIPTGSFTMGTAGADNDEGPAHKVAIAPFRASKYEITVGRFRQFVKHTGYQSEAEINRDGLGCAVFKDDGSWNWRQGFHWQNPGYPQNDNSPVVCISWNDAKAYADWLSKEWGNRHFRLGSEAEWEYVARAGTTTEFAHGTTVGKNKANCDGCGSAWDVKQAAPADSFKLNAFGLHAVEGNVWEWTEDCWNDNYQGAPASNSPWLSGECGKRVLRGGSWFSKPKYLRSAYRSNNKLNYRSNNLGFRLIEKL